MDPELERKIEDIKHHAKEARINFGEKGFDDPAAIVRALESVAEAIELLAKAKAQ